MAVGGLVLGAAIAGINSSDAGAGRRKYGSPAAATVVLLVIGGPITTHLLGWSTPLRT